MSCLARNPQLQSHHSLDSASITSGFRNESVTILFKKTYCKKGYMCHYQNDQTNAETHFESWAILCMPLQWYAV